MDQNHGLTPLEKCQFFDFLKFLLLYPTKVYFRSRMSKKTFSWPILSKKNKLKKWPFLDDNHGLTPLQKCNFSTFSTSYFYSLETRFFDLEYRKRHFPCLYCLKKTTWKNGHGLTPLQKCQFFDFFNFLFL